MYIHVYKAWSNSKCFETAPWWLIISELRKKNLSSFSPSVLVLVSNDPSTLLQLTFPDDADVTQYPSEHLYDYLKMFGVKTGFQENDTEEALPSNTVLTYGEREWRFPGRWHYDTVHVLPYNHAIENTYFRNRIISSSDLVDTLL